MSDTETLTPVSEKSSKIQKKEAKSDFPSMCIDLCKKINFKTAIFLFIVGTIIFSDVFIENCLTKSEYTDGAGMPTSQGTFIQMLTLILTFLMIDLLVQGKIL